MKYYEQITINTTHLFGGMRIYPNKYNVKAYNNEVERLNYLYENRGLKHILKYNLDRGLWNLRREIMRCLN